MYLYTDTRVDGEIGDNQRTIFRDREGERVKFVDGRKGLLVEAIMYRVSEPLQQGHLFPPQEL